MQEKAKARLRDIARDAGFTRFRVEPSNFTCMSVYSVYTEQATAVTPLRTDSSFEKRTGRMQTDKVAHLALGRLKVVVTIYLLINGLHCTLSTFRT